MKTISQFIVTLTCVGLLGSAALFNSGVAYASDKHKYDRGYSHNRGYSYDRGHHRGHYGHREPYGYRHPGYGYYHHNHDAWAWLAFAGITWAVLANLNEDQQRVHEQAQINATIVPIGETIFWNHGSASGSVTATRDGMSTSGRYCREFQHEVIVGGQKEQAYGTACQQPDGSWKIMSSGTP